MFENFLEYIFFSENFSFKYFKVKARTSIFFKLYELQIRIQLFTIVAGEIVLKSECLTTE